MAIAQLGAALQQIERLFHEGTRAGLSDAQLLDRFLANRDEDAFASLVERHGPMVLGTCRAILKDPHDTDDAFQATFLVLIKKAHSIQGQHALGGWLHRVAYRIALHANDVARRRRGREREVGEIDPAVPDADRGHEDLRPLLHAEIDRLPEKYRLPMVLCDLEGMTRQQAAHRLSWTEWMVRGRLDRARELLRSRLTRRGVTLSSGVLATMLASEASAAVPRACANATVRAAAAVVLGTAASGVVSAPTLLLVRGTLRAMSLTKWSGLTAVVLALALGGGAAVVGADARNDAPPPNQAGQASTPRVAKTDAAPAKAEATDEVVFEGQVLAPDGTPFSGAALRYWAREPVQDVVPKPNAVSDREGRFRFTVAKAKAGNLWQHHTVVASAEGYGPDWGTLSDPGQGPRLTLRLAPDEVPIAGRVLDLQGKPVAGAVVRLERIETSREGTLDHYLDAWKRGDINAETSLRKALFTPSLAGLPSSVKTGPDGRFRLVGIGRERAVRLTISGPGIEQTMIRVLTRPGLDPKTLNTPLQAAMPGRASRQGSSPYGPTLDLLAGPGRSLAGTVRDKATGKPLAGVKVRGFGIGEGHSQNVETTTDDQGRYHLDGLAVASEVRLHAFAGEKSIYLPAAKSTPRDNGLRTPDVDFELERGVKVRGRVSEKGTGRLAEEPRPGLVYRPLTGNTFFRDTPSGEMFRQAISGHSINDDGTFELVVGPGPGVILVYLHDRSGDLSTRYLPARKPRENGAAGSENDDMLTDMDGHAIFLPMYFAYALINPKVDDPGPPSDLRLEPALSRSGSVVGPDGTPLAGATIAGLSGQFDTPKVLPNAEFTVAGLDRAQRRPLVASHSGRKLAGTCIVSGADQAPVALKLEPWSTASGRLLDADGQPLEDISIYVGLWTGPADATRPTMELPGSPRVMTGPDGRFRVEGLVPGLAAGLFPTSKNGAPLKENDRIKRLTLQPGETLELGDIRIPR